MESYEFEINNPFDRGNIVGGFGYIEYPDSTKNKLVIMTKKDIEKRKPSYASVEFWGGTKKEKKNGKWQETEIDGWYEEMCLKTIKREVYSSKNIPLDPKKIDDNYQYMKMQELRLAQMQVADIADQQTATITVDIPEPVPMVEEKESVPDTSGRKAQQELATEKTAAENDFPGQIAMPGF